MEEVLHGVEDLKDLEVDVEGRLLLLESLEDSKELGEAACSGKCIYVMNVI